MYKSEEQIISEMVGKTFVSISGKVGDDRMDFRTKDGSGVSFYHSQNCCESVDIEDIAGDLNDLLECPLLKAECRTSSENPEGVNPEYQDSFTWPFYEFATVKGSVTVRWYGSSNGYYGEKVAVAEIQP